MDKEIAETILEQVARNLMAIEKLSIIIGQLNEPNERKLYSPVLKELLSSNYDLQNKIGKLHPELHPMFLGLKHFSLLRKKYEDQEHPVNLPSTEEITKAKELWLKMQRMSGK